MAFQRQFRIRALADPRDRDERALHDLRWLVVPPAGLVCHDMNVEPAMARDGNPNPVATLIAALVSRQIGWAQILECRG